MSGSEVQSSEVYGSEVKRINHLEWIKEMAEKENVDCEIIIREGDETERSIIEEADERQAELIVIGRHGRTGRMGLLMGSVTAKVIAYTSCPVLVVPGTSSIKWKSIVMSTDGSEYSEAAAKEALNLMKCCANTCTLNVIAVVRKDATKERIQIAEDAIQEIKQKAAKENIQVDSLLATDKVHESIHESIVEYAGDKDADIIVMGSHGRTGIKRLLMGSVVERVIGHTDRAVLVVKGEKW
ncbi:universal stress protein [Candidatus Desantisbacteria bacterium]|nr:universal stress protein [Candidatus Desantisbacteria bacterium]